MQARASVGTIAPHARVPNRQPWARSHLCATSENLYDTLLLSYPLQAIEISPMSDVDSCVVRVGNTAYGCGVGAPLIREIRPDSVVRIEGGSDPGPGHDLPTPTIGGQTVRFPAMLELLLHPAGDSPPVYGMRRLPTKAWNEIETAIADYPSNGQRHLTLWTFGRSRGSIYFANTSDVDAGFRIWHGRYLHRGDDSTLIRVEVTPEAGITIPHEGAGADTYGWTLDLDDAPEFVELWVKTPGLSSGSLLISGVAYDA